MLISEKRITSRSIVLVCGLVCVVLIVLLSVSFILYTNNSSLAHNLSSPYSVSFNQTIPINGNGSASFPVLPSSNVEVRVGNTNPVDNATQTITMDYYY
jgi:hypothetical protein